MRLCYEIFLRIHQILAIGCAVALWQHLSIIGAFSRYYVLSGGGLFGALLGLEILISLVRSLGFGSGRAEVNVVRQNDQIAIALSLPRFWSIRAGQYINIIIPGVSFWSFLQSHPLTISWWTEGRHPSLYFLVQPRTGFTKRILAIAHPPRIDSEGRVTSYQTDYYRAFFTGPHGYVVDVKGYNIVVLVATGIGVAAQIPFLKESIQAYNNNTGRTRRVHLIWQLDDWSQSTFSQSSQRLDVLIHLDDYHFEAETLFNEILKEDIKDENYVRVPLYPSSRILAEKCNRYVKWRPGLAKAIRSRRILTWKEAVAVCNIMLAR